MRRRQWLKVIVSAGVGGSVFQRALAGQAEGLDEITAEMIQQAQWVAGVKLSPEEQAQLAQSLNRKQGAWQAMREMPLDAFRVPVTPFRLPDHASKSQSNSLSSLRWLAADRPVRPDSNDELAFCSISELAALLRARLVTSVELTRIYLDRLKKYDPLLHCVVHLTEELAMQQAAAADRDISRGIFRGPLQGIPWGAKDLISVPGYPTTWGVPMFAQRVLDNAATVYQKLTEAGAVLVAKLSLGALAMGDQWHGGLTRNPWNPEVGSSGSSAGSASAVAAGLVGFAIGSETLGSILSPCRVCGSTGLRPTFGRVSRAGCMPLSWTMDKLGPLARTAEDTALVLHAISGWDAGDSATVPTSFQYPTSFDASRLRIGFVRSRRDSEQDTDPADRPDLQPFAELGCQLIEINLPDSIPARTLTTVLEVEGASVFEQWLNRGETEGWNAWPGIFRGAQMITAVDYLRAQRLRGALMEQMEALFDQVDVLVNANDLVITNLTGHPSLSFVDRFAERDGRQYPMSCVLTGRWYDDGLLATLAAKVQKRSILQQRPPLEKDLAALTAQPEAPKETP
ncbi:MAG: amidase [Planctomycetaceae bacterium]|nr:amidase [Planctomycetaceae bacterium]